MGLRWHRRKKGQGMAIHFIIMRCVPESDFLAQTSSASPPKPPVICPWCYDEFPRRQELERHSLSLHLPCWICCPRRSCPWRGSRKEELMKHIEKQPCAKEVKPEEFIIYDTKWLFNFIFDNSIDTPTDHRLKAATDYALAFVGERMMELQKTELWGDLWGRQLKGT